MNTIATASSRLHPVLWIAAISVTLLSLVGIASMTGLLPVKAAREPAPTTVVATAPVAPAVAPATTTPAAPEPAPAVVAEAEKKAAPAPRKKPPQHRVERQAAGNATALLPPPTGSGVPPDYVPP